MACRRWNQWKHGNYSKARPESAGHVYRAEIPTLLSIIATSESKDMSQRRTINPTTFRDAIFRARCVSDDAGFNYSPFSMDLHATHLWTGPEADMWHLFHELRAKGADPQSPNGPDKIYSSAMLADTPSNDDDAVRLTIHDLLRSPDNGQVVLCNAEKSAMTTAAAATDADDGDVSTAWDQDLEAYFGSILVTSLPLYACPTRPGDLLLDSRGTNTPVARLNVYLAAYTALTQLHPENDMLSSRRLQARIMNGQRETWASVMHNVLQRQQGGWIEQDYLAMTVPITSTTSGLISHGFSGDLPGRITVPGAVDRIPATSTGPIWNTDKGFEQIRSEVRESGDTFIGGLIGVIEAPQVNPAPF